MLRVWVPGEHKMNGCGEDVHPSYIGKIQPWVRLVDVAEDVSEAGGPLLSKERKWLAY
jgi:hypothetical protein